MTTPNFPRVPPGGDPSRRAFNSLSELAEERVRSTPALGGTGGFGSSSAEAAREYMWVRVTDSAGPVDGYFAHGYVQVTFGRTGETSRSVGMVDVPGGMEGTTTSVPLYELNRRQLSPGEVVRAWFDAEAECAVCNVNSSALAARCVGRAHDGLYPAVLVSDDGTGALRAGSACLLQSADPPGVPVVTGLVYHCTPARSAEGMPVYQAVSPYPRLAVQLVRKDYADGCPSYWGLRVASVPACGEDGAAGAAGPLLKGLAHARRVDLVVYPPPSPLTSSPAKSETDDPDSGVGWVYARGAQGDGDGAYATCRLEPGESSERLLLTDLGLVVPEEVVVDGEAQEVALTNVRWRVTVSADGGGVHESLVRMVVAGAPAGADRHGASALLEDDEVREYSYDPADPAGWDLPDLAPADVDADDFGLALKFVNDASPGADDDGVRTVYVGFADCTVAFDPAGEVVPSCVHVLDGAGGTYALDSEPRVEPVRPETGEDPVVLGGVSYQPAKLRRWDQSSKSLVTVEDVFIIYPS